MAVETASPSTEVTVIGEQRCFNGLQGLYSHHSEACAGTMRFAAFQPPRALAGERVPVITYTNLH